MWILRGNMNFEFAILDFIQNYLRTPFGDVVLPLITSLGNAGIVWVILAVVLLIIPKTRKLGLSIFIGLLIELLICDMTLKPLVARVRPYDVNTGIQLLIERQKDFSFPSGHTGASFVAIGALFFNKSKLWIPAFILGIVIAFSRLYLYVHYPTDVAFGIIMGTVIGFAGAKIAGVIYQRKSNKL